MELQAAPTAPPSRLHFIFRNERGLRAGWRLLIFVGILAGIAMVLLVAAGLLVALLTGARTLSSPAVVSPGFVLLNELPQFLAVLLATFVMSRIEQRSMGMYGLPLRKPALSKFATGFLLWGFLPLTLLLLLMRALGVFYFGEAGLHPLEALRWGALWSMAFLLVGLLEEYLFRGYALTTLAEGIGFWPAALILAAVFGYAHMGNSGETRVGIVDVCLFAIFAAATLRLTGNLWLAVGAHAGWDWGESFFYGVNDSGAPAPGHLLNSHVQGPTWLSGGSVGPEGSVLSSLLLVLMTVAFIALYRPRRVAAATATTSEEPPVAPTIS
jgi:uncharacterized protein